MGRWIPGMSDILAIYTVPTVVCGTGDIDTRYVRFLAIYTVPTVVCGAGDMDTRYVRHSSLCSRVEWFSLFLRFSITGTLLSIGYIFMSSIPTNRRILRHVRQNFHFQKFTGTLKMNSFFKSWHEPSSYIKDQLPKIEFKIRGCLVFFLSSKMAKTVLT